MTWILNLESREDTRSIAEALCDSCADLWLVGASHSDEPTGVLVCTSTTANLRPTIARAASAGTRVIVVAPTDDHPEPWSLLASGAADLVLWNGDPSPVLARLARLHEVERLVAAPPVSG